MLHRRRGCSFQVGVYNVKAPWECTLFEMEQSRVGDLIQGAVPKDLHKRFVIGHNDEIIAPLREISGLLEAPGNG